MNATNNEKSVPRALREVWEWKDAVGEEVRDLTMAEALKAIHDKAGAIREKYGIPRAIVQETRLRVAEDRAKYGAGDESAEST